MTPFVSAAGKIPRQMVEVLPGAFPTFSPSHGSCVDFPRCVVWNKVSCLNPLRVLGEEEPAVSSCAADGEISLPKYTWQDGEIKAIFITLSSHAFPQNVGFSGQSSSVILSVCF